MSDALSKSTWSVLAPPGLAVAALLLLLTPARAGDAVQAERRTAETPEVRICHREVPWSPSRVGRAGATGESVLEPWTAATMDVRRPLAIGTTEIEPGCYAWVCTQDEDGEPVLELRRLQLPSGSLPDPEEVLTFVGENLYRMPLVFDTASGTSPHLTIELSVGKKGLRLKTRYGDGQAETTFRKR